MVSTQMVTKWTSAIIGVTVLFLIAASLLPQAFTAGDSLNASGIPLGSFFASGGVVWVIVGAALVLALIAAFMHSGKGRR